MRMYTPLKSLDSLLQRAKTVSKCTPTLLVGFLAFLLPQGSSWAVAEESSPLSAIDVASVLKKKGISQKNFGFRVYDPEKKIILHQWNSDQTFIPASSIKILTTYTALKILGKDYRFKTHLMTEKDTIEEGMLLGDLYLVGGGDPFLTLVDITDFCLNLQRRGIRKIQGDFYYDDFKHAHQENISPKMREKASYNPGLSALSLEFNLYHSFWGRKLKSEQDPLKALIKRSFPDDSNLAQTRIPVKEPSYYTSTLFRKSCATLGIQMKPPKRQNHRKDQRDLKIIATVESPPLEKIVEGIHHYSNNLATELVGLEAAYALAPQARSPKESTQALKDYWKKTNSALELDDLVWVNHSGLSPLNRISPSDMVAFIRMIVSDPDHGIEFFKSTSVSGWRGQLRRVLPSYTNFFRVWAKPGGIDYAKALGGVFFTKESGRPILFSIFHSQFKKRMLFDKNKYPPEHIMRRKGKLPKRSFSTFLEFWLNTIP